MFGTYGFLENVFMDKKRQPVNKYYLDTRCEDCNRKTDFVYEFKDGKKLCRVCGAKYWAEGQGEQWEKMSKDQHIFWQRRIVGWRPEPEKPKDKKSDWETNVKSYPILKDFAKSDECRCYEVRRILALGHRFEIEPYHIERLKYIRKNWNLFGSKKWYIATQKKLLLLASAGHIYRDYYHSMLKYLQRRGYLTEKQLKSTNENYERFAANISKQVLRDNFSFMVSRDGRVSKQFSSDYLRQRRWR